MLSHIMTAIGLFVVALAALILIGVTIYLGYMFSVVALISVCIYIIYLFVRAIN